MRIKSYFTAVTATLLLSVPALAKPPSLEIGQPFPDIAFPSMEDGSPMSIASFRGQKIILHVFASW